MAASYPVRLLPNAPISTPLKWLEIRVGINFTGFTIKTVLKQFNKIGNLFELILRKKNSFLCNFKENKSLNCIQSFKEMKK